MILLQQYLIELSVIMESENAQNSMLVNPLFATLKPVSFTSPQAFDEWNRFKKKINWVLDGMTKPTEKKKVALLMSRIGDEGIDVYEQFELDVDPSFKAVIDAFDAYVQRHNNTVFERFQFFKLEQKNHSQLIDISLNCVSKR